MTEIGQDLRLRRKQLAPLPFLAQFRGEPVGVVLGFHVYPGAGVAVPEPDSTDIAGALVPVHAEAEFVAKSMSRVQATNSGTDYNHVIVVSGHAFPVISERARAACTDRRRL